MMALRLKRALTCVLLSSFLLASLCTLDLSSRKSALSGLLALSPRVWSFIARRAARIRVIAARAQLRRHVDRLPSSIIASSAPDGTAMPAASCHATGTAWLKGSEKFRSQPAVQSTARRESTAISHTMQDCLRATIKKSIKAELSACHFR